MESKGKKYKSSIVELLIELMDSEEDLVEFYEEFLLEYKVSL